MFNFESTKECMNIFLLLDPIFHMWEIGFAEWDNCNILDKTRDVLTCLLAPLEKSAFGCLSNLKEKQLEKLAQGFIAKTITIHDRLTKGGRQPNLKSMYEFMNQLKRKVVIRDEIMIHFSFPKPITNNQKPYSDEVCREKKLRHKLDKMLFSILDFELNKEFIPKI
jgi:hypothetical protein